MAQSRWCILLCQFSEDASPTLPVEHYKRLFTGEGTGSFNMTDFFGLMSHGNIDTTTSEVHGFFKIPIKNKAEYDSFDVQNASNPAIPKSRVKIEQVARATATAKGIDLNQFQGLLCCINGPMDVFGVVGGMFAVCDTTFGLCPSIMGQEMGHGYGLDHSRQDGSEFDYQDPWDVMSTANAYEKASAEYLNMGPGLNAWNMRGRGWLDEARVWNGGGSDYDTTITLRPLHRHDLPGNLAAAFLGDYLIEHRKKDAWDAAIPRSAVFVHRFENNHSYVMAGNGGNYDLVAGDVFGSLDQGLDPFSGSAGFEVLAIDDAKDTATLRLVSHRGRHLPQIYGTVFGGVAHDGGGGVVVNGRWHPVPPWDPGVLILEQIAVYWGAAGIADVGVRLAAQRSALAAVQARVTSMAAGASAFRAPALRGASEKR